MHTNALTGALVYGFAAEFEIDLALDCLLKYRKFVFANPETILSH